MLGEPKNQFSLPRAALSTRGAQKQIPVSVSPKHAKLAPVRGFLSQLCNQKQHNHFAQHLATVQLRNPQGVPATEAR
jgi:hypothetical protein